MIFAAIDLGTNTFHILIVEAKNGQFQERYRKRFFVKLAEGGMNSISSTAWIRTQEALQHFRDKLDHFAIPDNQIAVMGTAALRNAANREAFVSMVKQQFELNVTIISGEREAELISSGVKGALSYLQLDKHCIIDIGGGSVEFIIWIENNIVWKKSYPIGVAILTEKFHKNDPITIEQISALNVFLSETLNELFQQLDQFNITTLVGASGSFEVLYLLGACKKGNFETAHEIDMLLFKRLTEVFVSSSLHERLAMDDLPKSRADMVVVAFLIIDFLENKHRFDHLYFSRYAMKEGMLYELMNNI